MDFVHLIRQRLRSRDLSNLTEPPFLEQRSLTSHTYPTVGLFDIVEKHTVAETGMEFVDTNGRRLANFGINAPDSSASDQMLAVTCDCEIMRGDLVQILYEGALRRREAIEAASPGGRAEGHLKYEFGQTIKELHQEQQKPDGGVDVTFADGRRGRFDLVVGADGQGSRTRRLALGEEASEAALRRLGVHVAYFSVPRAGDEGGLARAYMAPGSRAALTRTGENRDVTQVYMFTTRDGEALRRSYREEPVAAQRARWAALYRDAGWQCGRFADALDTAAEADDFYAHEICQVKLASLCAGRVALIGDAGYCPSPFTGMGTTLGLIGTYVLAGELARHGGDVAAALKSYDAVVRPPIDDYQQLPLGNLGLMFPSTKLGVTILHKTVWIMAKVSGFVSWLLPKSMTAGGSTKGKEWSIPEYPELNLPSS